MPEPAMVGKSNLRFCNRKKGASWLANPRHF